MNCFSCAIDGEASKEPQQQTKFALATELENRVQISEEQSALRHCATFFGWDPQTLTAEYLRGGSTNTVVKVSRRGGAPSSSSFAFSAVVVRRFGSNTKHFIDRKVERAIVKHLSRFGQAKQILHEFENGQIESFLDGRTVERAELPALALEIGRKLARLHSLPIPEGVCPDKCGIWATLVNWCERLADLKEQPPSERCARVLAHQAADPQFLRDAVAHFRAKTERYRGCRAMELVLSHNDLLAGNILLQEAEAGGASSPAQIHFIDWEYGGVSERFFDLANHLCEYKGLEVDSSLGHSPADAERLVHGYCEGAQFDEAETTALLEAVNSLIRLPDLFWGVWGLLQTATSERPEQYEDFAVRRLELARAEFC